MTKESSQNVRLIADAYSAFGRGDIDAVVGAMHPDIEWHEAEHSPWYASGGHHGPGEVVGNVFARIPDDFERFEVEPRTFHDAGGTVIVEGRYQGRVADTGEELDAQVCHVWTVRDGRITGFRQYTDTWQFAQVTAPQTA